MNARASRVRLVAASLAVALFASPAAASAKPLFERAKIVCHCPHEPSHVHQRHSCCRHGIQAETCDCTVEAAPVRLIADPTVVPAPMSSERRVTISPSADAVVNCPSRLLDSPDPPPPIAAV